MSEKHLKKTKDEKEAWFLCAHCRAPVDKLLEPCPKCGGLGTMFNRELAMRNFEERASTSHTVDCYYEEEREE